MADCNGIRINAMKIKWTGPMLFVAAVALSACAPTQQGGDETESPTSEATASPTMEAEAVETPAADGTPEPAETPYDY